jgi:hypothetical protein
VGEEGGMEVVVMGEGGENEVGFEGVGQVLEAIKEEEEGKEEDRLELGCCCGRGRRRKREKRG